MSTALGERLGRTTGDLRRRWSGYAAPLPRCSPSLTLADLCFWHGCGTNTSRRESVTTAGAPTDQARVCLTGLQLSSAAPSVSAGRDGGHILTVPESACCYDHWLERRRGPGSASSLPCTYLL
jgi:hypothetical protein